MKVTKGITALVNPDDESYTEEMLFQAFEALEKAKNVKIEEVGERADWGFGMESQFDITGEEDDVDYVISEWEEWI